MSHITRISMATLKASLVSSFLGVRYLGVGYYTYTLQYTTRKGKRFRKPHGPRNRA